MTMNLGGGYPMMGGMNSMMNGMGTNMGLNTSMSAGSNYSIPMMGSVNQEFLMKYGCEDCFRKEPYPFEYPKEWIYKGMIWNELYLLRAFLQNNNDYEIVFFQNMMMKTHEKLYREEWPFNHSLHGGSFWMRKIR